MLITDLSQHDDECKEGHLVITGFKQFSIKLAKWLSLISIAYNVMSYIWGGWRIVICLGCVCLCQISYNSKYNEKKYIKTSLTSNHGLT